MRMLVLVALLMHWRIFHYWSVPGRVPAREADEPPAEPLPSPSASS